MCVDAQGEIDVGVSSNPLGGVRWCLELEKQAHHGVAESRVAARAVPTTSADPVK